MTTFGWTVFGAVLLTFIGVGAGVFFFLSRPVVVPETPPVVLEPLPVTIEEIPTTATSATTSTAETASTTP